MIFWEPINVFSISLTKNHQANLIYNIFSNRLNHQRMHRPYLIFLLILTLSGMIANAEHNVIRNRRSIELSSAQKLITDSRLPTDIEPLSYILELHPDLESSTFAGIVKINITWKAETKTIELHSRYDLHIDETKVRVRLLNSNDSYVERFSYSIF